jgi:outer membrane protein
MKRSLAIIFMLASGLVLNAAAQTSPAPAAPAGPTKVAVIEFQAAVGQTNEFQRNLADLQKKYEPKREQLKTMADEIDTLEKALQAQGDKLSPAEQSSRAKTIDDKKKQAQRFQEDAQNDLQGEMQETYNGVATKVFDVLTAYAQLQGYTLVLDRSAKPAASSGCALCERQYRHHQGHHRCVQREVGRSRSSSAAGGSGTEAGREASRGDSALSTKIDRQAHRRGFAIEREPALSEPRRSSPFK